MGAVVCRRASYPRADLTDRASLRAYPGSEALEFVQRVAQGNVRARIGRLESGDRTIRFRLDYPFSE